jgi:ELWxxDGT repeat protein
VRHGKAVAAIEILEGRRLLAGVPGSYPSYLAVAYDTLFFTATPDDVGTGGEVFRSDGTEAGTYLVKDVAAGRNGSNANYYTPFNGAVYFSAEGPPFVSEEPGHGTNVELWRTDGTPEGTRLVRDINPGMGQSFPYNLFTAGNALYFTAVDDVHGRELWKTDGTEAGTVLVKDLNPGPGSTPVNTPGVDLNGLAVFVTGGYGAGSSVLWRSDGTDAGTYVLKELAASWDENPPLKVAGGYAYFTSDDPVLGRELWRTDGTAAGTRLVKDINPGPAGSNPKEMIAANGKLYFAADDGAHGREVWASDGTAAGTTLLTDVQPADGNFDVGSITAVGGRLAFATWTRDFRRDVRVWRTDGTPGGTSLVEAIPDALDRPWLTAAGNTLFVLAGKYVPIGADAYLFTPFLYAADPASGGLRLLREAGGAFVPPVAMGDRVYFSAEDPQTGRELWRSDGTPEGTVMVKDINRGGRAPTVWEGYFFYNNSPADGNDPAADARDDAAVATDKMPLWANFTATEQNISNYSRGINGIMINLSGLPAGATLSADDFELQVGGEGGTADSTWRPAPNPSAIATRSLPGGGTRVTLTWPDRAIYNTWLRVKVKATAATGIVTPEVFYFGHLAGDGGAPPAPAAAMASVSAAAPGRAVVDAWDVAMTSRAMAGRNRAPNSPYDYNKDGWVNARDLAIVRSNYRRSVVLLSAAPGVQPVGTTATTQTASVFGESNTDTRRRSPPVRRSVLA